MTGMRAATKRDVARDDGWHLGSLLVVGEAEPEPSRLSRLLRAVRSRLKLIFAR